jgi:hypothetical protein
MATIEQRLAALAEQAETDNLAAALPASKELTRLLGDLVRREPGRYRDRLAEANAAYAVNLAEATMHYRSQGDAPAMVHYGQQAEQALLPLTDQDPAYRALLADVLDDLAFGLLMLRQLRRAEQASRRATSLLAALAESDPYHHLCALGEAYYTAACIARARGRRWRGRMLTEHAADRLRQAMRVNPEPRCQESYHMVLDSLHQNVRSVGSRRDISRIAHHHS